MPIAVRSRSGGGAEVDVAGRRGVGCEATDMGRVNKRPPAVLLLPPVAAEDEGAVAARPLSPTSPAAPQPPAVAASRRWPRRNIKGFGLLLLLGEVVRPAAAVSGVLSGAVSPPPGPCIERNANVANLPGSHAKGA
mmetsp:Transcript_79916/g.202162  ORF Transcript_79916/g.202162 Transcript_79916/m.202162 type:complete len:136 (+) Transcript_79916:367-774(+)